MKQATFIASCPICGRVLFKGKPSSYIEGGCPKCKEYLQINFTEQGFQASVKKEEAQTNTAVQEMKTEYV